MTTRARQTRKQLLGQVTGRLKGIAANQAEPLTPEEADHYAAVIERYWAEADRDAEELHQLGGWRRATTKRLAAANAAIQELERDRDQALRRLTELKQGAA